MYSFPICSLPVGGASGIGKAVCQAFAKEGAKVAVVDINRSGAKETIETLEGNKTHFKLNKVKKVKYPVLGKSSRVKKCLIMFVECVTVHWY